MIKTVFTRFLRIIAVGIIASLPIRMFEQGTSRSAAPILILSLLIFLILTELDTYAFSKAYWKIPDIALGIYIPLALYVIFNMTAYLWMPVSIYNYMLLPFRTAELIFAKTLPSIISVNCLIVLLSVVISLIAAHFGKELYLKMDDFNEYDDI